MVEIDALKWNAQLDNWAEGQTVEVVFNLNRLLKKR